MAFPVCFSLCKHYWPTVVLFPFLTCPAALPILISQLSLTVFTARLHVFSPTFSVVWFFVFYTKKEIRESSLKSTTDSVKQFGSRSSRTFCRAWSGSKLFANVFSRRKRVIMSLPELWCHFLSYDVTSWVMMSLPEQWCHFLSYDVTSCLFQAQAPVLLEQLEREKELLRIFLHVSQNDNHLLRRMHLKSFLMVPVQRIMKWVNYIRTFSTADD